MSDLHLKWMMTEKVIGKNYALWTCRQESHASFHLSQAFLAYGSELSPMLRYWRRWLWSMPQMTEEVLNQPEFLMDSR